MLDLVLSHPTCPTCWPYVVDCDGTSYWCEGCGGTWDLNGTAHAPLWNAENPVPVDASGGTIAQEQEG